MPSEFPVWEALVAVNEEDALYDANVRFDLDVQTWAELREQPALLDAIRTPTPILVVGGWAGLLMLQLWAQLSRGLCEMTECLNARGDNQRRYCAGCAPKAQQLRARQRKRRERELKKARHG